MIDIMDIGEEVVCDICNECYTDSDEVGGVMIGSYAYCPKCEAEGIANCKKFHEEQYIGKHAKPNETFKEFVLRVRNGDNTIKFYSF